MNPGFVIGPSLVSAQFASGDVIKRFMMNDFPGIPKISMDVVDVRDLAQAHLQAVLVDEAAGHRFLLIYGSMWFKDFGDILHSEFGQDYKIPRKELPKLVMTIYCWFDKQARTVKDRWGIESTLDTEKAK